MIPNNIRQYRPIAVNNVIGRILTKALAVRVTRMAQDNSFVDWIYRREKHPGGYCGYS